MKMYVKRHIFFFSYFTKMETVYICIFYFIPSYFFQVLNNLLHFLLNFLFMYLDIFTLDSVFSFGKLLSMRFLPDLLNTYKGANEIISVIIILLRAFLFYDQGKHSHIYFEPYEKKICNEF